MLQRIAPRLTSGAQALALPFDDEVPSAKDQQTAASPTSLYTLAVLVRIGLVAAILVRALALWQW